MSVVIDGDRAVPAWITPKVDQGNVKTRAVADGAAQATPVEAVNGVEVASARRVDPVEDQATAVVSTVQAGVREESGRGDEEARGDPKPEDDKLPELEYPQRAVPGAEEEEEGSRGTP